MAAITATVATVASAAYSGYQQRKAASEARDAARKADRESVDFIAQAGKLADADILQGALDATQKIRQASAAAEERLAPFADTGAFRAASDTILGPQDLTSPLAQSIAAASEGAVTGRGRIFDTSGPVGGAASREAMLAASGALPVFQGNLLGAGQEEIATAGDISGIRRRGFGGLSDLVSSTAAGRASALVGQSPQLADVIRGGQETRLLSELATDQNRVQTIENLAGLAGTLRGRGYI